MIIRDNAKDLRLVVFAIFVAILGLMMLIIIPFTQGQSNSKAPAVFPPDSKPYGLTYGEWTAKWWQWVHSIPKENNPATDTTGRNCAQSQNGPVWFLAGTGGGSVERTCTIPAGKAILFPIINGDCSYLTDPTLKTPSELRACVKADQDKVTSLDVIIDGAKLQDLQKYRMQSPLFSLVIPQNDVFGDQAGTTQAVSDGYWILLQPLSPGKHNLSFAGTEVDYTTTGQTNFLTKSIYHLTVQ